MMLHRHFEAEKNENITTLKDVTPEKEFVSEVFQNEEKKEETPKRARRKKTETE